MAWDRPPDNKFWRDADTAQLKALIDIRYVAFSSRNHDVSFIKVADDRRFHPIRDYLNGLPPWDEVKRIETLLARCLQADDTPYVRAVTERPSQQLLPESTSQARSSTACWFSMACRGSGKALSSKISWATSFTRNTLTHRYGRQVRRRETAGLLGGGNRRTCRYEEADIEKVKAFLSTSDDKYRPSYGKTVESHPRQCIIIASVNGERGYLRDITGNRRFWS